jgi:hypothetical protein
LCEKNVMAKINHNFDKIGKMTKIQASVVGVVGIEI